MSLKLGRFASSYLKASDFPEPQVLIVKDVEIHSLGDNGKEEKAVVFFEEHDRGCVLNKTNTAFLISLFGSEDAEDWKGQKVEAYIEHVLFQGRRVPAIRFREPTPF